VQHQGYPAFVKLSLSDALGAP